MLPKPKAENLMKTDSTHYFHPIKLLNLIICFRFSHVARESKEEPEQGSISTQNIRKCRNLGILEQRLYQQSSESFAFFHQYTAVSPAK